MAKIVKFFDTDLVKWFDTDVLTWDRALERALEDVGIFYGTSRYGQRLYGDDKRAFQLRVILRNNTRTITLFMDLRAIVHEAARNTYYGTQKYNQGIYTSKHQMPVLLDINWEYNRIGGCGACTLVIALPYTAIDQIAAGMEVQIDCLTENGLEYKTWYRGEVGLREQVLGGVDIVTIQAQGYVTQLDRVRMDNITYASTDTGSIVADIIDTYVISDTDIKRTNALGLVVATDFTIDTITFNGTAMEAIRTLAELTGNAEWGVNLDREIFFKIRGETVTKAYNTRDFTALSESEDFSNIKNQYKLFGSGDYVRERGDSASQTTYDKRSDILQQRAIGSNTVADQYIDGFLTETKNPIKTFAGRLSNVRKRIEGDVIPLGLVKIMNIDAAYKWKSYQLGNINYSLGDGGDGLDVSMSGGKLREDITETLAYFDYRLNQLVDV